MSNRKRINRIGLVLITVFMGVLILLPREGAVQGVNEVFVQTDWSGGADTAATAVHPTNQTGWTKFYSKDAKINTAVSGKTFLDAETFDITDTMYEDWQKGTRENLVITNNPGEDADLQLDPTLEDPFVDNLGRWVALNETPELGWFSSFARVIHSDGKVYIYAIWERDVFGRFSVEKETWEFLENIPGSTGPGAALTYPGTGDFIYATRGGGQKHFYKYKFQGSGADTWTRLSDVPQYVQQGGSLAATADKVFCTVGSSPEFYEYDIATDTWTQRPNIYGSWEPYRQSNLVYPGTGSYLYLNRGYTTPAFCAYHITKQKWDYFKPPDAPYYLADLCYPGEGDYLYGWSSGDYYRRFFRYRFQGTGSGVWEELPLVPIYAHRGTLYHPGGAGTELKLLTARNYSGAPITFDTTTLKWNVLSYPRYYWYNYHGADMAYDGGDYLYLIMGGNYSYFWRYSISNDTSERMASTPFGIYYGGGIAYSADGYVYALRGYSDTDFARYNPATDTWETLTPAPASVGWGGALVAVGTDIYAFRGDATNEFWKYVYDANGGTWTPMVNPTVGAVYYYYDYGSNIDDLTPGGTFDGSADLVRYKIEIDGEGTPNTFRWSDTGNDDWDATGVPITAGTPIPLNHGVTVTFANETGHDAYSEWYFTAFTMAPDNVHHGSSLCYPGAGDYIYATRYYESNAFWKYNLTTGKWEQEDASGNLLTTPVYMGLGTKMKYPGSGDYLYMLTQVYYHSEDNMFFRYAFKGPNEGTWEWLKRAPLAYAGYNISMEAVGDKVYAMSEDSYQLFEYTISTGEWSERVQDYGPATPGYGSVVHPGGDIVYLFMGRMAKRVWLYSLSQDKFIGTINTPFFMGNGTKAAYPGSGNFIYVIEGNMTPHLWRYDYVNDTWSQLSDAATNEGKKIYFTTGSQMDAQGDVIYLIAGQDPFYEDSWVRYSWTFLRYTISTDTWESSLDNPPSVEKLPTYVYYYYPRGNRLVYVPSQNMVFWKPGRGYTGLYVYKIDLDTWDPVAYGASCYNGCLYYHPNIGTGDDIYYFSGGSYHKFQRYSISEEKFYDLSNPPFGVYNYPLDSDMFYPGSGDFIYLTDGGFRFFARYSISKDDWDIPPTLPTWANDERYAVFSRGKDSDTLYAGGYYYFHKYSISNRTWTQLTSPYNAGLWVWDEWHPCLIYPGSGDYLYTTRGRNRNNFARYLINADSWEALAPPPDSFYSGHQLVGTPARIYALRGSSRTFWAYDPVTNTWSTLAETPDTTGWNASLCYPGTGIYIYATRGNRSTDFWRYNISNNTWEVLAGTPAILGEGSGGGTSLVYPGAGDYLYLIQGASYSDWGATATMFRYSISTDTWEEVGVSSPQAFRGNAKLVYPGAGDYLYAYKGVGRMDFSKFLAFKKGKYTSDVKIVGRNKGFDIVDWQSPSNDVVFEFKARTSDDYSMSDAVAWEDVPKRSKGEDLTSSYPAVKDGARYIQYQIEFCGDDIANPPTLNDLTLKYDKYPPIQELISSPYNAAEPNNRIMRLTWSETQPPGSDIRFQLRTAPDSGGSPGAWSPWLGPGGVQTFNNDYSTPDDYAYEPTIEVVNGVGRLKKILQSFAYTQRIVLDNTEGTKSYTDNVTVIEIDSTNKYFWEHVNSDGSDVRFADAEGNVLSYNLHAYGACFDYANKYAKIFVKVPSVPAGEKTSIYLKYGNPDATSQSDSDILGIPMEGLVGWWRFDEGEGTTAADSSGNGNTGTLVDGPTWTTGKYGNCLNFDESGSGDYVNVPNFTPNPSTEITVAAWIKPSVAADSRAPIVRMDSFYFQHYDDNRLATYWYGWTSEGYHYSSANSVPTGEWSHVAVTWDQTNGVIFYINGIKDNQISNSGTGQSTNWVKIGQEYSGRRYNGLIDQVTIYNRALTDTEIQALFSGSGIGEEVPYYFILYEDHATSPSLSGWEYRLEIEIDNTNGPTLTNYPAKVELTPAHEGFWNRCRSDGYDIRFVDSDNETILDYARTSFDYANKEGTLYVEVPTIEAGALKTIYLYYGRSDAADVSNYDATLTKDFGEKGYNVSGVSLDGVNDRVSVQDSSSLDITDNVTLESQVKFGIDYWPDGWGYRKRLTFDNTGGEAKTSFIVKFNVAYQGEMNNDFSDLRFWETDHSRKLRYRIKSFTSGVTAEIYLMLPELPADSTKDIYMYYGNAGATSEGDATLGEMPANGLIAYWEFDEGSGTTAADSSGNGNDGTVNNASWVEGKYGTGLKFVGNYSYVVKDWNDFTLGAHTIGFWLNADVSGGYRNMVSLTGETSRVHSYYNKVRWYNVMGYTTFDSSTTLTSDKWYYVVCSYDGSNTAKIYINGVMDASANIGSRTMTSAQLDVGNPTGGEAMNGIIDEVTIYNRALTDAEVQLLMNSKAALFTPAFGSQETEPATLKWLPGFGYRKKITLDNTGGDEQKDITVQFDVAYEAGNMNADYSDLRFVDTDGSKLKYRIVSSDTAKATVLVNVPLIPENSKKDIYMYYGNVNATSESNPIIKGYPPESGIVGWWELDEENGTDFYDKSPLHNAFKFWGNLKRIGDCSGGEGSALEFDGIDGHLRTYSYSEEYKYTGGDKTFSIWLKPANDGHQSGQVISSNYPYNYRLWYNSNGTMGVYLSTYGAGDWSATTSESLSSGQWHNVILTLTSAGEVKLYFDNTLVGDWTHSLTNWSAVPVPALSIGTYHSYWRSNPEDSWNYGGGVDQVLMYNRVLSPEEREQIYGGTTGLSLPATFAQEETQPAINRTIIGKAGAYELKFDNAGLSAVINGVDVASILDYKIDELMHLALTYDGANVKLYMDGIEKASAGLTDAINTNANPLIIGEGIEGLVDEAKVWNVAHRGGLINEYKEKYLDGDEAGLVCYLPFNENAGTAASDLTANANNATLENGAGWIANPFSYSNGAPVALYHMDEGGGPTTDDSSGNGNTLSLSGAVWSTTDLTGFSSGNSLEFMGIMEYLYAADSDSLDATNKISIEAWIRPDDNIATRTILLKGDDAVSRWNYKLTKSANNIAFSFYNDGIHSHGPASGFIVPGEIYQVVVTYDQPAGIVKMYKNGELIYSGEESALMVANTDNLIIGKDASGQNPFDGIIDEVRIYKRVLTAQEVLRHYEHRANYINLPLELNIYEPPVGEEIAAYATNNPVIQPVFGVFYNNKNIAEFQEISNKPVNTDIKYQLSWNGFDWYWFNGASWEVVEYGYTQANTAQEVNTNLSAYLDLFPDGDFYYRAYLHIDPGVFKTPSLDNIAITLKTGDTYYVDPGGGTEINPLHSDAFNDQWYQYKMIMYSDGEDTAILDDVSVDYIKAYIEVLTPNGGEELTVGSSYVITWDSQAIQKTTGYVKIEYSTDGGSIYNLIAENCPNTGTYTWDPVPVTPSHDCLIKISSEDFPAVSDTSDSTFTILSLEIVSPNGGEILEQGRVHNIIWISAGGIPGNLIRLDYSTDGGTSWTKIVDPASTGETGGEYSWTVPYLVADSALIKISASQDPDNISDVSDAPFSIVPTPEITVTAPQGGENWSVGTTHTISWMTNSLQFADEVVLYYSTDDFVADINEIDPGVGKSIGTPQGSNPNDDIIGSYDWNIPDVVSDTVKVKVKEASVPPGRPTQTEVEGISSQFSIIEPTITITSPISTDIWVVGDTHDITWSTVGTVSDNLLLEYTTDGAIFTEIATGQANDGTYSWTIPPEAAGENVQIRITDNERTQVKGLSEAFIIYAHATIIVDQPNGGEELTIGTTYEIKWRSFAQKLEPGGADYNMINMYYSTDNGANWILIAYRIGNTGTYSWTVPDAETTTALVKIEDENDTEAVDESDAVFSIVPPTITITFPNGGELFYATGDYTITWTSIGSVTNNLTLQYSADGGTSWNTFATGEANDGSYDWSCADVDTTEALIKIIDASRPVVNDASNSAFIITPPTITITAPAGGEEIPIGTYIEIKWTSTGYEYGAIRDDLTFRYSSDGGTSWTDIATGIANTGSYNWQAPDVISDNCMVMIFDATRVATSDTSGIFKIVLPYVRLVSPNGGEQWPIGTQQEIRWTSVGTISDNLTIEYSTDNFVTSNTISINEANDWTYLWTVPDDNSSTAKVRIIDADRPEVYDISDFSFAIVNPIIRISAPNGGELWTVGDTENITWENIGSVGNDLKIEYSKDNFVSDVNTVTLSTTNTGSYAWEIPDDVSATVRVRITDNTRAGVWDKSDADFTILPIPVITITSPVLNDIWRVGDIYDITWTDNGGLISNNLTIRYSTNGGQSWPGNKIIATGAANSGSYTWTIPDAVSDNCKIKITDESRPSTVAISDVFEIGEPLITITSPNGGEVWAVGDRAPISWTTEGAVSDNLILEYSPDGGTTYYLEVAGQENSGSYTWTIDENALSANALFRITDGERTQVFDVSDTPFIVNSMPTIDVSSPNGGEEWVLGETRDVTWSWTGLSISDNLLIEISNDDFITTRQVIATGVPNTGTYSWNITDDTLTGATLKLRITDGDRTEITDKTDGYFRIRGGFTLIVPNGSEKWTAKSSHAISWETRGNIPKVKLDYTVDDGLNWITIAASVDNIGTYDWTLPDTQQSSVKVRVSDTTDATVLDESDNPFSIVYQSVKFRVLDYDTLQHLDDIAVSEPATGWNDTGLVSPIERTNAYSYGTYTTFFTKTNYIDNSVTWTPPKQGTDIYVVTCYLENQASAQVTWEAILTYSYSPANDNLSAVGSLQRKGKLIGTRPEERLDMGAATLNIYEPDGATLKHNLVADTPSDTGMYNFTLTGTGFEAGYVYPATLTILYREREYTSSANIDVGSEILQYEFFTQTAANLAASVEAIEQAVAGGTEDIKAHLDQKTSEIKTETGQILTATQSTLPAKIEETKGKVNTLMKSRILNRENIVKSGKPLPIRYRTYSGLSTVYLDLYDAKGKQKITKALMKEIGNTGVYEYEVTFKKAWGKGDFSIVCSEPVYGTMDAIIISVLKTSLEQIGTDMATVIGLTTDLGDVGSIVDDLNTQFGVIEGSLKNISKDIVSDVEDAVKTASDMENLYNQLTRISTAIKGMESPKLDIDLDKFYNVAKEKTNDIKYLKNKTQELKAMMELNQKMIDNVANEPVIQTWYEYRSIVLKAVILNPSDTQEKTVPFKAYLPKEARPEHVMSRGDLNIAYDTQQGSYYVHASFTLKPKEIKEIEIEMKDIWQIKTSEIESLRLEARKVYGMLKETEFSERAEFLLTKIEESLNTIIEKQKAKPVNPADHISAYRENLKLLQEAKTDLSLARTLLSQVKPIPMQMTWKLVTAIIAFLGLLSLGFYIVWQKQVKLAETPTIPEQEKK